MTTLETKQDVSNRLAERRRLILAVLLIAVAAALAYGNTLGNGFVFDDFKIIRDNTTIRSFSTVPRIFANMFVYRPLKGQGTKIDPSYRPIRYLSYAVDYQFTGLNPTGYHISNILYHIIASVLVFLVLKRLTGHFGAALGVALIFVVHPVHTESVAYLTGRKDVLCTIFYLLAFLSFLKYRQRPKVRYAVMLPVFFALAFMAKEMAITLPAVMLLYDFGLLLKERKGWLKGFVRGLLSRPNIAIYLPVVLFAVFFGATALLLKNPAGMGEEWVGYWGGSLYVSSITMLRGVAHYIRLLFIPFGLTADYSYSAFPVSRSLVDPGITLISLLLLAALLAIGICSLLKKYFLAGFAVLFFFVTLIPVLQIVPLPERLAERFLYLPSLALMILTAMGLKWLAQKSAKTRALGTAAVVLLIITFFTFTHYRNRDWKDPLTLHGSVVALHPDCARSQLAVAEAFAMRANNTRDAAGGVVTATAERDYSAAVHHFSRVLKILPPEIWQGWRRGYALNALAGRGIAHANLGRHEVAIRDLERLLGETDVFGLKLSESPQYLHVHFNLGEVYFAKGDFKKAAREFDIVTQMVKKVLTAPTPQEEKTAGDYMARACLRRALSLKALDNIPEGLRVLLEGLEFARGAVNEISLFYQVGQFQLDLDKNKDAIKSFENVLELCKQYESSPEAFAGAGPQSVILGVEKARSRSWYRMAQALDRTGKFKEAVRALEKAVEVAPDFLDAHFSLGDFYFKAGKLKAAEKQFRRVLKDRPNDMPSKQKLLFIEVRRQAIEEKKKPAPQKVVLLYQAALRDYGAGELEKAADKLLEALQIAGRLKHDDRSKLAASRVRLLLGRIRYDQGQYDNAKTHLQAGLDVLAGVRTEGTDFPLGECDYHLALTLARQGKKETAVLYFRKAVPFLRKAAESSKSAVEAAELLVHSATANNALGKHDEEFADYRRAAQMLPEYPYITYVTARAALRAGKVAEAGRLFTRSMKKGEKVAECAYEMGRLMLEGRKYTDAIANFQLALEKTADPYYLAACNYYLGHAYYALEFYEEAADAWREYLKHEKDPEKRELMQKRLETDPKLKQE
jgi:tetratricopeptide (TPR) repeat protein